MFPFATLFTRRSRPRTDLRTSVLDEEYEWVFGRKPSNELGQHRERPGERQDAE